MTPQEQVAIRVSGLLQAVINSGVPEEQWQEKTQNALILHGKLCRAMLAAQEKNKNG